MTAQELKCKLTEDNIRTLLIDHMGNKTVTKNLNKSVQMCTEV